MRGFKLFLTLPLIVTALWPAGSHAAADKGAEKPPVVIPTQPEAIDVPPLPKERVRDYIQSGEGLLAPTWPGPAKNQFIGYAWPFTDRDAAKELGGAPVVVELFTTQGCIFCPAADRFFNDLIEKVPNVIGLSCHVDYLDVRKGSLSMRECTARQRAYAQTIPNGNIYSPQTVINGRVENYGFSFEEIYWNIKGLVPRPPQSLTITKSEGDTYSIAIPELGLAPGAVAEIDVLKYRKPVDLAISEGVNRGAPMHYKRSVTSIASHAVTGKAETVQEIIVQGQDEAGAVIMVRSNGVILAVTDLSFQ